MRRRETGEREKRETKKEKEMDRKVGRERDGIIIIIKNNY